MKNHFHSNNPYQMFSTSPYNVLWQGWINWIGLESFVAKRKPQNRYLCLQTQAIGKLRNPEVDPTEGMCLNSPLFHFSEWLCSAIFNLKKWLKKIEKEMKGIRHDLDLCGNPSFFWKSFKSCWKLAENSWFEKIWWEKKSLRSAFVCEDMGQERQLDLQC